MNIGNIGIYNYIGIIYRKPFILFRHPIINNHRHYSINKAFRAFLLFIDIIKISPIKGF